MATKDVSSTVVAEYEKAEAAGRTVWSRDR